MPLRFAVVFLALMLIYPQPSLSAAQEAFSLWQMTVAPSLLPFFALIPALTSPEATACFARLLRLPCRFWGVPEDFAGAVGVAFAAGSPAGARALMRIASRKAYPADALLRATMLCAGVSPGFLVSGVGAGMLGDASAGMTLLVSLLLALTVASLLLRCIRLPEQSVAPPPAQAEDAPPPILFAANGILSILVWMVLFAVLSRIAGLLLPAVAPCIPFAAEFSSGCAHAVSMNLPLSALGAVIGFGGVCAGCQNLSVLAPLGIPARMYFCIKLIHASLCAVFAHALSTLRLPALSFAPQHVLAALMIACLLPLFHKIMTPVPK